MDAFENLEVWKRSCRLSADLYRMLDACRVYGFRDQVTRAALSIPTNIAEGYERNSSREYRRYLGIAKGSAENCGPSSISGSRRVYWKESEAFSFWAKQSKSAECCRT